MSKKFVTGLVAGFSVLAFSVFSFSNAMAMQSFVAVDAAEPLTTAKQMCAELKQSYTQEIKDAKAVAISLNWTKTQLQEKLKAIRDYRNLACKEAKLQAQPLTSAVKMCAEAKKNYSKDKKNLKAFAISLNWTKAQLQEKLKSLKDSKNLVCKEAKTAN